MAFLDGVLWGNTYWQILFFIGIIVAGIIVGKIIYWIFKNVFLKFSAKTKSDLDDIIVNALQGPSIFFIFFISFTYANGFLTLSERAAEIFGKINFVLIAILIAWLARNIVNSIIMNYFSKLADKSESDLDDHLMPVIRGILNVIIFAIAIVYIIENLGYDIASLIAGLGIGGLAFALAAQDTIKNLFGGFTVFADKPFKIGDRIKVGTDLDGFVKEIGVRSTKIKTFDGTIFVIPNSKIVDSVLENVSAEKARRIKITVGLEYGTSSKNMEKACKILKEIVKKNKKTDDKAIITFKEFADSSLNIQVIYWIKDLKEILSTIHEINMEIKKRFDKEKLSFAFPTRTVHMKQ